RGQFRFNEAYVIGVIHFSSSCLGLPEMNSRKAKPFHRAWWMLWQTDCRDARLAAMKPYRRPV
ncbi:hypothetical protein SB758_40800, partial [Burkholderia sp. SIMBA_013]